MSKYIKLFLRKLYYYFLHRNHPIFTVDWFSGSIHNWSQWLRDFQGKSRLRFLEIGSYEGRSTRWLLENILTAPDAKIYCIDTFQGSMEHQENNADMRVIKKNFYHNIRPYRKKVSVFLSASQTTIRNNSSQFPEQFFDFIYIDGSHKASDVLADAVLYFWTLKENGILIFDDYGWSEYDDATLNPKIAIDAWLDCYKGQYEIIHKSWQVCIRKLGNC